MITLSNITAGLVLGFVVASAVPALAGNRHLTPGHDARAQVIEQSISGESISPERAQALRECNGAVGSFRNYTWGVTQDDLYRNCMVQHGQPE